LLAFPPWKKGHAVTFPISGVHLNPVILILVGFVVGVFGGFFGVGGSFIAGPALFGLGLPMNFVVGTDLAHLVGKSLVAARRHAALGHIDLKLAGLMMISTIPGVELGALWLEHLKKTGHLTRVLGSVFVVVLLFIAIFMAVEVWLTLRAKRPRGSARKNRDYSAFSGLAKKIQRLPFPPYVRLPKSNIERISFWSIVVVSFISGIFSGFLGGGAGYIRMPSMIYLLGLPTHIAVGTDLFEVIVSASYGTFTHALKGNVDILVALVMHTGAAVGAQIGAQLTQYLSGVWIRMAFIPLPLIGALILLHRLG
jgi:uncharacterized membrane protein YfcA